MPGAVLLLLRLAKAETADLSFACLEPSWGVISLSSRHHPHLLLYLHGPGSHSLSSHMVDGVSGGGGFYLVCHRCYIPTLTRLSSVSARRSKHTRVCSAGPRFPSLTAISLSKPFHHVALDVTLETPPPLFPPLIPLLHVCTNASFLGFAI